MLVTLLGLLTCTCIPTELKTQVWTFHFLGSPVVFCLMALPSGLDPEQRGTKEAALNLSSLISTGMLPLPHKCIPFLALEWDPSFSKGMQEKRMFRGPGSGFQQLLMFSPHSQWDLKITEILKVPIRTPPPRPPFIVSSNLREKNKKQFRPFGWLHLDQASNCFIGLDFRIWFLVLLSFSTLGLATLNWTLSYCIL